MAGEAALCLLPAAPRALGHTHSQMSPHRPTLDQPSRITQGKPVKALSPNCRGGSFTGRRQTAATPHVPPPRRAAGKRAESAGVRPPHNYERLTALVANSRHSGWRRQRVRPCAQVQSRFCASVQIGAWGCAGRRLLYARRPQFPGTERTPGPTRAPGRQTAADGLPTAASSVGSEAQSLESEQ